MTLQELTQASLKELLHYDPDTGAFTWRSTGSGRRGDGRAQRYLGTFDTPGEAHQAYLTAKRQLHAGCTI